MGFASWYQYESGVCVCWDEANVTRAGARQPRPLLSYKQTGKTGIWRWKPQRPALRLKDICFSPDEETCVGKLFCYRETAWTDSKWWVCAVGEVKMIENVELGGEEMWLMTLLLGRIDTITWIWIWSVKNPPKLWVFWRGTLASCHKFPCVDSLFPVPRD